MKTNTMKTSHLALQSRQYLKIARLAPSPMRGGMPSIIAALGAALCFGFTTAYSQTLVPWTTVDNITNPGATARGIAVDGSGNLFVAGSIPDAAGITHAVIEHSSRQGDPGSWVRADYVPGAQYERIVARGGVTVAAASQGGACLIRGRTEGVNDGKWTNLMEPFRHWNSGYQLQTIWDVKLDISGNIYVVAEYMEKKITSVDRRGNATYAYVSHPIIFKREGGAWLEPIELGFPIRRLVISGSDIYCSGDQWRVRKYIGGSDWAIVDNFVDPQFGAWEATDMAMNGSGQLFVTGRAVRVVETTVRNKKVSTQYSYWVTRKGVVLIDGTWTWEITDDFRSGAAAAQNHGYAITVDKYDNVSVAGSVGVEGQTLTRWATRQYSPFTKEWSTTDPFEATSHDTRGNRIAADPLTGNVFATGGSFFGSSSSWPKWIVRRQLAPVPTLVP